MVIKRLLVALTLTVLALLLASGPVVYAGSAGFTPVAPVNPQISVPAGGTGTITVSISGTNIGSFEVSVSCTPSVINFTGITAGSIPGFTITANNTAGSASIVGYGTSTPTNGGTVATIAFTAVGAGGAPPPSAAAAASQTSMATLYQAP